MSNRDVEFVIRAQDRASAQIESISKALDELKKSQSDAGISAKEAEVGIGALEKALGDLKNEVTVLAGLGKVATDLERVQTTVTGFEKALADAKTSFSAFSADAASASANTARLATALSSAQSALEAEKARFSELSGQLKTVSSEMTSLNRAQETFPARLQSSATALDNLTKKQATYVTKLDEMKSKLSAMPAVRTEAQEASYQRLVARIAEYETKLETVNSKIAQNKTNTEAMVTANANGAARIGELSSRQTELSAAVQASANALKAQKTSVETATSDFKSAASAEKEFSTAAERAGQQVEQSATKLTKASTALQQIRENSADATKTVGLATVSVDAVGEASKRASADLQSIATSIRTLKTGKVDLGIDINDRSVATYKALIDLVRNSRTAFDAARQEAAQLGSQLANATGSTTALSAAFGKARANVETTEATLRAAGEALGQFRGQANGSFIALEKTIAALNQTGSAASSAASGSRAAAGAIREMNSATGSGSGSSSAFAAGIRSIYGESRQAMSILQRLRGEVLALISSYAGIQGLRSGFDAVITSIRSLEAAENRLGAAFEQDSVKQADGMNLVRTQSMRLGQSFQTTANEYSKFAVAAQSANFSMEGMNKIFRAVAEAGRVNKLSVADLEGVYLALTQMISKGKITAEELNRQLANRLPGAFTIMSKALGHTTSEMNALMKTGSVLANEENLTKFADELTRRFGSQLPDALKSTSTQLDLFKNNLEQAAMRVNAGGFGEALRTSLVKLNEVFNSRAGRDFFLGLGTAAGHVIDAFGFLVDNASAVASVLGALASVKIAGMFISMAQAAGQSYAQLQSVRAAAIETTSAVEGTAAASRVASTGFITLGEASRATAAGLAVTMTELKSIGATLVGVPAQSNVLTRAWGALVGTTVSLKAGFLTLGTTLRATAGSFTAANVGALAFRATTVVLTPLTYAFSGALRVATVAAMGLWRALGGLPGLLITVGTYFAGEWLAGMVTKTDDATKSIDEHQRIVTAVAEAYDNARDKASGWQKAVKDVTSDQITANVRAMRAEYDKAKDAVTSYYSSLVDAVKFAGNAEYKHIQDLKKSFEDGKISATSLRESLEKIYAGTKDDGIRVYLEGLLKVTREAQTAGKRLDEAGEAAKKFGAEAPVGSKIAEEMKKAGDATQLSAAQIKTMEENYAAAFQQQERLRNSAGKTATETKKVGDSARGVKELEQSAKRAADSVKGIEDVAKGAAKGLGEVGDQKKKVDELKASGKGAALELDKMQIPSTLSSETKAATADMRGLLEAAAETTGSIQKLPAPDTSSWSQSFASLWQRIAQGAADLWNSISGSASQGWSLVSEAVSSAVDGIVGRFSSGIDSIKGFFGDLANTVKGYLDSIGSWIDSALQKAAQITGIGSGSSPSQTVQSNAQGGHIVGPGTGTSDSILSWISNGEYVVRAAAVARYGVNFFNSLNSMRYVPAYASGGAVSRGNYSAASPASSAQGGSMRPVNLHLGDRAFSLQAPVDVARNLVEYTRAAAARSAGRSPNWAGGKRK